MKSELIIRSSKNKYHKLLVKMLLKIYLIKIILDLFLDIIIGNKTEFFCNLIQHMILFISILYIDEMSYSLIIAFFIRVIFF